jgi:thioredoxin 2
MASSFVVHCPHCGAKNRIPAERWGERAVCGKCKAPLPLKGAAPHGSVEIADWNFRGEVIDFPGPVALEFYSPSCGYSRKLAPVMEELVVEYSGKIKFGRMDITGNRLVPSQYQITGTPTLIFFKDGRIVNRINGFVPKADIEGHLKYLAGNA